MVQSVTLPPTTPQPLKSPLQKFRERRGVGSGGAAKEERRAGEAEQLTPTKMVAVFRPGCLSSGRNTDIPVRSRTATRAARADLSNR